MTNYPLLEINLKKIHHNAKKIIDMCNDIGIDVAGVAKGINGLSPVAKEFENAGAKYIASSRIREIKNYVESGIKLPTMLIRIPMISEAEEIIKYVDISLNSELDTIIELNKEAEKQNVTHGIILMYDLGDLREGYFDEKSILNVSQYIEDTLKNIKLLGIGTNLSCYGSIVPTEKNLNKLIKISKKIENKIGRKLDIISGGATTSLPLVFDNKMPKEINNLRIGEAILLARDLEDYWKYDMSNFYKDAIKIKAEVIEVKTKDSHPIGKIFIDAFGNTPKYKDIGKRKRALLALGKKDIGHHDKLIPTEDGIKTIGSSSDHLIIDIDDYEKDLKIGDIVEFELYYQAMLFSAHAPDVKIKYI